MIESQPRYLIVRPHRSVARSVEINDLTLVDVDSDGRVLGIETLDGESPNWLAIFLDDRLIFQE